jgi:hypothetical protein
MSEKEKSSDKEKTIEIFLQGEGISEIQLVRVPQDGTLRDVVKAAQAGGAAIAQSAEGVIFFTEDSDHELEIDVRLKDAGIGHRHRLHCHRCRQVEVTVNFNGVSKPHKVPPSKTVAKVKRWADDQFGLKGVDATEHALQICGTNSRPDEDTHIGALVQYPNCKLCFDLVPKKRVEG